MLSSKGGEYEVDTQLVTCTCPDFVYRRGYLGIGDPNRMCKHLNDAFKAYKDQFPKACSTPQELLEGATSNGMVKRSFLDKYVGSIYAAFNNIPKHGRFSAAGEYRRRAEVCNPSLIFVLTHEDGADVLSSIPDVLSLLYPNSSVLMKTADKLCMVVDEGVTLYFYDVTDGDYACALAHYTGSQEEVLKLRAAATSKGMKLDARGLYSADGVLLPQETEAKLYYTLGLEWVDPSMR